MTLREDNQFDVLSFLMEEPKIIDDFRESELFYVADLGRGVYPRSLIDMLIDMELVAKFTPYKSTSEDTEAFINTLGNLSDERKAILEKYTSFQLTEFGKETAEASETRKDKNVSVMESVQLKEQYPAEVISIPVEQPFEGVELSSLEHIDHSSKKTIEPEVYGETQNGMSEVELPKALHNEKTQEMIEEISLVEGEADEDELAEEEMRKATRLVEITEELEKIELQLNDNDIKRKEKKKLKSQRDELQEEKEKIEHPSDF